MLGVTISHREALTILYERTAGPRWRCSNRWLTKRKLGQWFGVTARDEGRVVELVLAHNVLRGSIPEALTCLTMLELLDLSSNELSGNVPDGLSRLTVLKKLKLTSNQLSGNIPEALSSLSMLKVLDLSSNQLSGNIPEGLPSLLLLKRLNLASNQLSGNIPEGLSSLTVLKHFNLSSNQLSGSIPEQLSSLTALEVLSLSSNLLSGNIRDGLSCLTGLKDLNLTSNQLGGHIPEALSSLSMLKLLDLSSNQLSGNIPEGLSSLLVLKRLNLASNQLNGTIPEELSSLTVLEVLTLSSNLLSGVIPEELSSLTALKVLDLTSNQLKGSLPDGLSSLNALVVLSLSSNQLSGDLPAGLSSLTMLKFLDLSQNQLNGTGGVESSLQLVTHFRERGGLLRLHDNPMRMPPEGVVQAGLPAMQRYLLDMQKAKEAGADMKMLRLLKVVLVGSPSAGKTSLMRSIVATKGSPTLGDSREVSTVGIDLRRHLLKNTAVEFYDCAGQVDYYGMHQTFLSRRALYLLVWDLSEYHDRHGNDLDEVIRERIMQWLCALQLRAPGSTVIMVANKCDKAVSVDDATSTAERVEGRVRDLLQAWGSGRDRCGRTRVNLLGGTSRVSCLDYSGIPALIDRILEQSATSIWVPPTWSLALEVLGALRDRRPSMLAARRHLGLPVGPGSSQEQQGDDVWEDTFVTRDELSRRWKKIIRSLGVDLRATGDAAAMVLSDPESALEGALWISEFAGQILSIDNGAGIFLDVVWLSKVLSPILSQKLHSEFFPKASLCTARDELVQDGILRVAFARHLWGNLLSHASVDQSRESVVRSLYRVLLQLGVIVPLGQSTFRIAEGSRVVPEVGNCSDVLVIMRLPERCSKEKQELLDSRIEQALVGAREVTLRWRFHAAGRPYGMLERLIAACHAVGEVERSLCWRCGAFFKSHAMTEGNGDKHRVYFVVVEYDVVGSGTHDVPYGVVTVRMIGSLRSDREWAALRYVASAMIVLSREWPGVKWEAWLECGRHPTQPVYLAPALEAKIGDLLLPAAADLAAAKGVCDCRFDESGVLHAALKNLGRVIDSTRGNPFEGQLDVGLQGQDLPGEKMEDAEPTDGGGEDRGGEQRDENAPPGSSCRRLFEFWRPFAWRTAAGLWAISFGLFLGATVPGIIEENDLLWKCSLAVVVLLLLAAAVASGYFFLDGIRAQRSFGQAWRASVHDCDDDDDAVSRV